MTQTVNVPTPNGNLCSFLGSEAAERATRDIAAYVAPMTVSGDTSTFSSRGATTIDKIGASASVVGALAGVVGLSGSGGSQSNTINLDIINISSSAVVPYSSEATKCYLKKMARPLASSDRVSLNGYLGTGFEVNASQIILKIALGSQNAIDMELIFALCAGDRWGFKEITIDGYKLTTSNIMAPDAEELQAITFLGKEGYPSFSLYSHVIRRNQGSTYLLFCDAVN